MGVSRYCSLSNSAGLIGATVKRWGVESGVKECRTHPNACGHKRPIRLRWRTPLSGQEARQSVEKAVAKRISDGNGRCPQYTLAPEAKTSLHLKPSRRYVAPQSEKQNREGETRKWRHG